MRIACPACDATYEVPDALIGAGRKLRCAKCTREWMAQPPAATPAVPPPAPAVPPATEALAPRPATRRPPQIIDPPLPDPAARRQGRAAALVLAAAWIGSGLLLGGLLAGAWVFRGPIVEAWPPAARAYLLLGAAKDG